MLKAGVNEARNTSNYHMKANKPFERRDSISERFSLQRSKVRPHRCCCERLITASQGCDEVDTHVGLVTPLGGRNNCLLLLMTSASLQGRYWLCSATMSKASWWLQHLHWFNSAARSCSSWETFLHHKKQINFIYTARFVPHIYI